MAYDVIVIGAGLAGLSAAQHLELAGKSVLLVEARDRIGGRVWTRRIAGLDYPVELGPEWFDADGAVHRLIARNRARVAEARGTHWLHTDAGFRDIEDLADGGKAVHRRLADLRGEDRSLRDALRECCGSAEYAGAATMLTHYVEGFHAADPDRLSLRWLLQVEQNQPAERSSLRTTDGSGGVADMIGEALGNRCEVRLGSVVQAVHWRKGRADVVVTGSIRRETLSAPAVVVTLPLAVLAATDRDSGTVIFSPPLTMKRGAFDALAVGSVVKVILAFDEPFWHRIHPLEEMLFVQDFSQPIPTWWTTSPAPAPIVTGWAAGPQVARLDPVRGDALRDVAVASFAGATAIARETVEFHLRSWHHHDWQRDPYARGAYSWVAVGGTDAHRVLAEPVDGTLFFAGEATCGDGINATMDGAIASGRRAAEDVLTAS